MELTGDLKHIYINLLQKEIDQCSAHQEKLVMVLNRALFAMKNFKDRQLRCPKDLLQVKGIGETTMRKLSKRLEKYCADNGFSFPKEDTDEPLIHDHTDRTKVRASTAQQNDKQKARKQTTKKYVPRSRSGGYGILLALLEMGCDRDSRMGTKKQIIAGASRYCDQSYEKNPSTREYYSAWDALKSLKKNSLVVEKGRPSLFKLTDEGKALAESLKSTSNISFDPTSVYERRLRMIAEDLSLHTDEDQNATMNFSNLMQNADITANNSLDSSKLFYDATINTSFHHERPNYNTVQGESSTPIKQKISRGRWNGIKYELWKPMTYDIVLLVDHREVRSKRDRGFFTRTLEQRGIKSEGASLTIGDMLWVARHKKSGKQCVLNFIVERKRLDDLVISIRDNRFLEQKNRLQKTGSKHIFYLVEETTGFNVSDNAEVMKTSIWSTVIYNGFHIKRTKNADTTIQWLIDMSLIIRKIYEIKSLVVINHNNLENQASYLDSLTEFRREFEKNKEIECCHNWESMQMAMGKTNLMTVKELYLRALMSVRGVSLEKALMIQSKFATLKSLLLAYRSCSSQDEGKILMYKSLRDAPGNRKIGKALSETLWEVFGKSSPNHINHNSY